MWEQPGALESPVQRASRDRRRWLHGLSNEPSPARAALRRPGDSYTIGTSVNEPERWPDQLVGALADFPIGLDLVANLAVNGFTSADVIAVELPACAA